MLVCDSALYFLWNKEIERRVFRPYVLPLLFEVLTTQQSGNTYASLSLSTPAPSMELGDRAAGASCFFSSAILIFNFAPLSGNLVNVSSTCQHQKAEQGAISAD